MRAIILAGGFGVRLKSEIGDAIPKPMAPIGGMPFLAIYLNYLRQQGVGEAIIAVHHLRDAISGYFGGNYRGMRIRYAEEEKPMGTGGAIRLALQKFGVREPVLTVNGDTFAEVDMAGLMRAHRERGAMLSMSLFGMPDCSRYGEAVIGGDSVVSKLVCPGGAGAGWINAGVYAISPGLFDGFDLPDVFSFETDFIMPYCDRIKPLAWRSHGYFIDIGVPADYARAKQELSEWVI